MNNSLPDTIYDSAFSSFDPYSIFQDQNTNTIGKLGLDYVTKTARKKIVSVVTFHDGVFGLTDTMVAGLVKVWKSNTRERNRKLLRSLIKFHIQHPSMDIETGLYTLMILTSLPIGKTTLAWYSQLQNPIRGNAIWLFIRNVPKSISEGSNYFDNVGKDLIKEQEIPCKYYFDKLNKTLIAYLSLTCFYLNTDPKQYFRKLEYSGYEWLDCQNTGTKEIYEQTYKYVFPKSTFSYFGPTIADLHRGFDLWGKNIKLLYRQIGQPMEDSCQYVNKHGKDYLWAFSSFEEKEKEEKAQHETVSQ